jgi:hypothetical protein
MNSLSLQGLSLTTSTLDTLNLPPFWQCILLRIEHDVGYLLYQLLCH